MNLIFLFILTFNIFQCVKPLLNDDEIECNPIIFLLNTLNKSLDLKNIHLKDMLAKNKTTMFIGYEKDNPNCNRFFFDEAIEFSKEEKLFKANADTALCRMLNSFIEATELISDIIKSALSKKDISTEVQDLASKIISINKDYKLFLAKAIQPDRIRSKSFVVKKPTDYNNFEYDDINLNLDKLTNYLRRESQVTYPRDKFSLILQQSESLIKVLSILITNTVANNKNPKALSINILSIRIKKEITESELSKTILEHGVEVVDLDSQLTKIPKDDKKVEQKPQLIKLYAGQRQQRPREENEQQEKQAEVSAKRRKLNAASDSDSESIFVDEAYDVNELLKPAEQKIQRLSVIATSQNQRAKQQASKNSEVFIGKNNFSQKAPERALFQSPYPRSLSYFKSEEDLIYSSQYTNGYAELSINSPLFDWSVYKRQYCNEIAKPSYRPFKNQPLLEVAKRKENYARQKRQRHRNEQISDQFETETEPRRRRKFEIVKKSDQSKKTIDFIAPPSYEGILKAPHKYKQTF